MALDKTVFEDDLAGMIDDMPSIFQIAKGSRISCAKNRLSHEKIFGEYGYGDNYKLSIIISRDALLEAYESIPAKGTAVKIDGVSYRVMNDDDDGDDIAVNLHLGELIT